ncbi:MAG: VWA domain-containing protein [Myxococcales bacterium]|nr:VWA domain-containing protein [Myxococcales bacterium]
MKLRSLNGRLVSCVATLTLIACAGDDASESGSGSISASGFVTSASASNSGGTATSGDSDSGDSGDSDSGDSDSGDSGSTSSDSTSTTSDTSDATSDATTNPTGTTGTSDSTTDATTGSSGSDSDTEGSCAEVKVEAENKKQPADIIFAIDNSGSMDYEEGAVQDNMNDFSNQIIQSGIDAHVVLISNNDICIAAPLGSGQCPNDNKPPSYLHVNDGVGSNNALNKILDHHADWKDMMRPDGAKHVVVVSDDNSDMGAAAFDAAFKALGPSYEDYQFHAIVGTWDVGDVFECASDPFCCATIADEGKVYKQLVNMTGGVLGPLCENGNQKFGPLFNTLSMEVVQEATIACEWDIPEPMGMDIDFGKVNVDYIDGMGGVNVIPKVEGADNCGDLKAWYYDDENMPTKIFACPALCELIQGDAQAQVNVKFGCESIIPQ